MLFSPFLQPLTRIVAVTPGEVAQAVSIIAIATKMINTPTKQPQQDEPGPTSDEEQQEQQQQEVDAAATTALQPGPTAVVASPQLLVFQPVLVGALAF